MRVFQFSSSSIFCSQLVKFLNVYLYLISFSISKILIHFTSVSQILLAISKQLTAINCNFEFFKLAIRLWLLDVMNNQSDFWNILSEDNFPLVGKMLSCPLTKWILHKMISKNRMARWTDMSSNWNVDANVFIVSISSSLSYKFS
jgi:uncharacterized membrane protein YjdF